MDNLITLIEEDVDWRISQISVIRKLIIKSDQILDKEFLIKHSVPIIYSLWEGFLKNTYEYIDSYIIRKTQINSNFFYEDLYITTYFLDKKCNFNAKRKGTVDKIMFVEKLFNTIDNPPSEKISRNEITRTTFNYDNTCKLLSVFSLPLIDPKYKDDLDEFLKYRNKLSHGDRTRFREISFDKVNDYANMIIDLMYDIQMSVEKRFLEYG
ncbi:MAG: hypothetical protein LBM96_00535 [Methanobrevibacter sp.]|jgi:hypothetical protein|nr:hypothetical protein [Candidatus Methanoflexus mossambicus]